MENKKRVMKVTFTEETRDGRKGVLAYIDGKNIDAEFLLSCIMNLTEVFEKDFIEIEED